MDDLDRIVEMWVDLAKDQRRYGSHLEPEGNREPIRLAISGRIVDDGLLVAREGDGIVGFVMFGLADRTYEESITRGVVRNVYVEPECRNEGVGGALFDAAEEALSDLGADAVTLEVMAENEGARRFYQRRGYRPHRVEYELTLGDERGEQ